MERGLKVFCTCVCYVCLCVCACVYLCAGLFRPAFLCIFSKKLATSRSPLQDWFLSDLANFEDGRTVVAVGNHLGPLDSARSKKLAASLCEKIEHEPPVVEASKYHYRSIYRGLLLIEVQPTVSIQTTVRVLGVSCPVLYACAGRPSSLHGCDCVRTELQPHKAPLAFRHSYSFCCMPTMNICARETTTLK